MTQIKKSTDLQKKVEELIRENKTLRKKLVQLRKVAHTGVNYSKPKNEDTVVEKRKEPKECDYCRGEIKKISVYNLDFEVCQKCKTRHKLNKN
jgi:regulator of replication initiation timing